MMGFLWALQGLYAWFCMDMMKFANVLVSVIGAVKDLQTDFVSVLHVFHGGHGQGYRCFPWQKGCGIVVRGS